MKPFCKRCLIRDINDTEKLNSIKKYIELTPDNDICSTDLYESRLEICKACKNLNLGICIKTGYYVEARAYRQSGNCPLKLF